MFEITRPDRTMVVRAIVQVTDRFPLRNTVVNVVVPAYCDIAPVRATERHFTYPTVTAQPRVNPVGTHGCKFTVVQPNELNPQTSYGFAAKISGADDSAGPFRVMVELSCTPPPRSDVHRFRFALIGVKRPV
jgi:hypothetical protein